MKFVNAAKIWQLLQVRRTYDVDLLGRELQFRIHWVIISLLEFSLFKFLFCMFKTLFLTRIELLSFLVPIIVCSTTEIGKANENKAKRYSGLAVLLRLELAECDPTSPFCSDQPLTQQSLRFNCRKDVSPETLLFNSLSTVCMFKPEKRFVIGHVSKFLFFLTNIVQALTLGVLCRLERLSRLVFLCCCCCCCGLSYTCWLDCIHTANYYFSCVLSFFWIDYVFKLFIFFSIDLEIMQPCRGNFIASLTLNNCSRQKEIMMKGLVENNTRHSGTDTNEG